VAQQNKVSVDNSGPPRVIPEVAHDITHLTIGLDPDCCETMGCDWAAQMHSDTNSQKMEPKVRPHVLRRRPMFNPHNTVILNAFAMFPTG